MSESEGEGTFMVINLKKFRRSDPHRTEREEDGGGRTEGQVRIDESGVVGTEVDPEQS